MSARFGRVLFLKIDWWCCSGLLACRYNLIPCADFCAVYSLGNIIRCDPWSFFVPPCAAFIRKRHLLFRIWHAPRPCGGEGEQVPTCTCMLRVARERFVFARRDLSNLGAVLCRGRSQLEVLAWEKYKYSMAMKQFVVQHVVVFVNRITRRWVLDSEGCSF